MHAEVQSDDLQPAPTELASVHLALAVAPGRSHQGILFKVIGVSAILRSIRRPNNQYVYYQNSKGTRLPQSHGEFIRHSWASDISAHILGGHVTLHWVEHRELSI